MTGLSMSAIEGINFFFLGLNFVFYLFTIERTPYAIELFVCYLWLSILLFTAILIRRYKRNAIWYNIVMLLYPVVFLFGIFETFFMLLPYFNLNRYDEILISLDKILFGINPTVWIERFREPVVTDVMYTLYLLYFPMPLVLLGLMYGKGLYEEIEEGFFSFLCCYYMAYILYFIIPATGPRFHLTYNFTLDGYLLTRYIRGLIDFLEPNKFDAFPSLHAGILFMTMFVAKRYHKGLFNIYIPITIGILVSLIYCRYHYIVDVIAGIIVAIISIAFSMKVYPVIKKGSAPHF